MEHSLSTDEMLVVPMREPAQAILLTPVIYESMDVWRKEQEERNAMQIDIPRPLVKKQSKSTVGSNSEAIAFEDEATQGLGIENWVGLLQRYADVHPNHKLNYEEIVVNETAVSRFKYFVTIQGFLERFGLQNPSIELSHATFSTKKKAKQYAAQQAVKWLISNKHMPTDGSVKFPKVQSPLPDPTVEKHALQLLEDKNWIGRLVEYLQSRQKSPPIYKEITTGGGAPRFCYTLKIDGVENMFGNADPTAKDSVLFSSKKPAKQYISKQALNWLTAHEPPITGTHVQPLHINQQQQQQQPLQPADPITSRPGSPPYTSRVPDLCNRLNFPCPTYVLTPASDVPNCPLWDGYADFSGHPRIGDEGKVGCVRSLHGKKNARETVAKQVYEFLEGVEKDRLSSYEEEDRKRKRSSNSPQE